MVQRFKFFCLVFKGSYLKQKAQLLLLLILYIYIFFLIVYELNTWSRDLNSEITLKYCLFGAVKLAKNADPDKYVYCSYGIRFDSCSEFSLPDGSVRKNVIIVRVDMSSSVHTDNKKKDILILDIGPTQGLDHVNSRSSIFNYIFQDQIKNFI